MTTQDTRQHSSRFLTAIQLIEQSHPDIKAHYNSLPLTEEERTRITKHLETLQFIERMWSGLSPQERHEKRLLFYANVSGFFERIFAWDDPIAPGCGPIG